MRTVFVVALLAGLTGCTDDTYRPTICTAVNFNTLDCVPTDATKQRYDCKTDDLCFLGMACMPEKDFAEGKKRARKILEGLESHVFRTK